MLSFADICLLICLCLCGTAEKIGESWKLRQPNTEDPLLATVNLLESYWKLVQNVLQLTCSAIPFEKGRTPMLSATPWITDSTTVQNIVIIAIVSKLHLQVHSRKHSDNEPPSSSRAIGRHVGM
jgi:hypothetical protein